MELRHLRYFIAIADHGGVRHAADRLNIAQPAVSRQIKDLEAELGFDLLRRAGRGVVLTDAGKVFAEEARAILAQTAAAIEKAQRVADGRGGRLKVGLLENASWSGPLPLALNRFARVHPEIQLDVVPLASIAQIEAVRDGALDAGFVYRQDNLVESKLTVHPLATDDVVLAAPADMAFGHDGPLDPAQVDGLAMVRFRREAAPAYFDRQVVAMTALGIEPQTVQQADNETTILSLVSAGVGCALVNSANMQRPPRGVQFRKVKGLSVPLEFVFIHRANPGSLTKLFTDTVLNK
ncbi:LysR family transcriptional regulator [Pelagibius litoralis]|uniref:LysR family transcriptional regulator n=1 Tax=Pelagibius litoralis TaxID=374515 RepID=A0A967C6G4_9PROT|nr:LysR family transcriptional regulator [Pelagibius litoralis]NIA68381.1 LysR family transcriptional regulator [Pelagibius litoralis]